jgi:hypothetical protein
MKSNYAKSVSRTTLAISLLLAAALPVAGCGGSQEEQGSQGEQGSQEETTTAPSTTATEETTAAPSGESTNAQGGGDATAQVVAATEAWLATLDDAQREQASFDFNDELKTNWSNFPTRVVPRNGVPFSEMTEEQQQAALAILQAALSEEGYQKTIGNMVSDQAQSSLEGGSDLFSAGLYYFAVFGTPSDTEPWMLQYGGHHYAINLTVSGQDNVFTPSFTGVQPSEFNLDEVTGLPAFVPVDVLGTGTIRPMAEENDLGFELINALDPQQQEQAILDYDVSGLVLGPDENVRVLEPEGLPASEMPPEQQALLLDLVREWAGIANEGAAEERMSEIEANLDETYFAWYGPTTNGEPTYYRITGPTLHIEFNHEEDDILHVHSVYRDPTNDYGE